MKTGRPFFANLVPAFKSYGEFAQILDFFSKGTCGGCRSGECVNAACGVQDCFTQKGVNFCFECGEFPCARNEGSADLKEKWLRNNRAMKERGVEAFYRESKGIPRY